MQADFHWINVISHIYHFGWKKDAISLQLYNGDSSKPTTNSSQYSISKLYWWGRREEKKILSKTSDRFSNTECMLHLSCVISLLELCTYTLTHTLTPWSYAYSGIRLCMSVGKSLILWEFFRKKSEPNCSRNYSKWIKCLNCCKYFGIDDTSWRKMWNSLSSLSTNRFWLFKRFASIPLNHDFIYTFQDSQIS